MNSDRKRDRKARYKAFKLLAKMSISLGDVHSKLGPSYWRLCVGVWERVFHAGYLSVMVDGMRSISASDEKHNYFIKISLDRLQNKEYWRVDAFPHPGWETPYWRAASLDVAAAALTPPNRDQYFLCDNVTVCFSN